MKIYGGWRSPFVPRPLMYMIAKGFDFELEGPPGGLKSDEYKAINPILKIPALDHDGIYIVESEVICEYLEDLYPEPPLRPKDPVERARGRTISRILDLYFLGELGPIVRNRDPATRDQAALDAGLDLLFLGLDRLEAFIGDKGFAVGNNLSIADCAIVPVFIRVFPILAECGVDNPLEGRPKLTAYWQAIQKHPAAERTISKMTEAT